MKTRLLKTDKEQIATSIAFDKAEPLFWEAVVRNWELYAKAFQVLITSGKMAVPHEDLVPSFGEAPRWYVPVNRLWFTQRDRDGLLLEVHLKSGRYHDWETSVVGSERRCRYLTLFAILFRSSFFGRLENHLRNSTIAQQSFMGDVYCDIKGKYYSMEVADKFRHDLEERVLAYLRNRIEHLQKGSDVDITIDSYLSLEYLPGLHSTLFDPYNRTWDASRNGRQYPFVVPAMSQELYRKEGGLHQLTAPITSDKRFEFVLKGVRKIQHRLDAAYRRTEIVRGQVLTALSRVSSVAKAREIEGLDVYIDDLFESEYSTMTTKPLPLEDILANGYPEY